MNRKKAFTTMALLCLVTGIIAGLFVWVPDIQAIVPTTSSQKKQAALSAPMASAKESADAVLPTPAPASTEAASTPEPTTVPDTTTAPDTAAPSETPEAQPEPQYTYTAIQKSKKLFIRDDDSLSANIIGYLMPGDSGDVISIGPTWVLLKHGEIEGYSYKEYLQLDEIR